MILDIDNSASVQAFVKKVTEEWFNPDTMYTDLKASGKTNSSHFWCITDHMVDIISEYLNQTSEEFLNIWNQKCSKNTAMIMGYHCTRHSNKMVFIENGIVPLSENTIEINENQNVEVEELRELYNKATYSTKRQIIPYFILHPYHFICRPENHQKHS